MRFDICLIVRRQSTNLAAGVKALVGLNYGLDQINIFVLGMAECMPDFEKVRQQYDKVFASVQWVENAKYAKGINQAVGAGNADGILLIDAALHPEPDLLANVVQAMHSNPQCGGFECRQLPLEQDTPMQPASLEVLLANIGVFAVRRVVWQKLKGLDSRLQAVCAGIDFGWRLNAAGAPAQYLPSAVAFWQAGQQRPEDEELARYAELLLSRLVLAAKYGKTANVFKERKLFREEIRKPRHFEGVRRVLLKNYVKSYAATVAAWFWRVAHLETVRQVREKSLPFMHIAGRGYAPLRAVLKQGPLVSVVVRTSGRPQVLRGALQSLRNQTYVNFEVIVVEDGPETSRALVDEFNDLLIRYISTGLRIGRGRAGNVGLLMAEGVYANFLDDDDYFYPDHLEVLLAKALENAEADLVIGCAMAAEVEEGKLHKLYPILFDRIDVFTMSQMCQIPIQSVLFKHALYENCGGLNEELDANEDWHMWMRFLAVAKRITPGKTDILRATSVFVQPVSKKAKAERLEKYKKYNNEFYNDENIRLTVNISQMRGFYDGMISDMRHLAARGELEDFLEEQARRDE